MALAPGLTPQALVAGLFPATLVATPSGWRQASALRPGDLVLTVHAGPQPLRAADPQRAPLWALVLPALAVGNHPALALAPGQALQIPGTQALMPAQALEGWRGIEAGRSRPAQPLLLRLDKPALIHAGPGLVLAVPGACLALACQSLAQARATMARRVARDLALDLAQAALRGM